MKPQSPCLNCTPETGRKADPNCHGYCEKFLTYRSNLEAWNAKVKENRAKKWQ